MIQIPLRSDLPAYQFLFDLEGTIYQFHFRWNGRMKKWLLGLKKQDGTEIVTGVPVFVSRNLLKQYVSVDLPAGVLGFLDTSGQELDPGEGDLGDRVILLYKASTE